MMMRVAALGCCGLLLPAVLTSTTSAAAWGFFGSSAEEKVHPTAQSHKHLPDFHNEALKRLLSSEDGERGELTDSFVEGQTATEGIAANPVRRLSEQVTVDLNSVQGATSESSTRQSTPATGRPTAEAAVVEDPPVHATDGKVTRRLTIAESSDQEILSSVDPRRLADDLNVRGSVEREGATGQASHGEAIRRKSETEQPDGLQPENNQRRLQVRGDVTQPQGKVEAGGELTEKSGLRVPGEAESPSSEAAHDVTRLLSDASGHETERKALSQITVPSDTTSAGEVASRQLSALRGFPDKSQIGIVSAAPTAPQLNGERVSTLPQAFDAPGGKGRILSGVPGSPSGQEISSITSAEGTRRLAEEMDVPGAMKPQISDGETEFQGTNDPTV